MTLKPGSAWVSDTGLHKLFLLKMETFLAKRKVNVQRSSRNTFAGISNSTCLNKCLLILLIFLHSNKFTKKSLKLRFQTLKPMSFGRLHVVPELHLSPNKSLSTAEFLQVRVQNMLTISRNSKQRKNKNH